MDELKQRQSIFSDDRARTTTAESPETTEPAEASESAAAEERRAEAKEIAESLAGNAAGGSSNPSRYSPVTISSDAAGQTGDFVAFLKQTKRVWLAVVGGLVGLIVLVNLAQRGFSWISQSRERRHEQAVASVTPERLIARCGQPAEDLTKNDYPILMRTMTYQIGRNEAYVLAFSRTAEEKSDWVFLSMKDANGAKSYDTPDAQVAAMSCINSTK